MTRRLTDAEFLRRAKGASPQEYEKLVRQYTALLPLRDRPPREDRSTQLVYLAVILAYVGMLAIPILGALR